MVNGMEEEKMDRNNPKYYETFKYALPDDVLTAEYIRGNQGYPGTEDISALASMVEQGEVSENILKGIRALALATHNRFIKGNIEKLEKFRYERNVEDLRGEITKTLNELIELQGRETQLLRNLRDEVEKFWIGKPYSWETDEDV